ncbi:MAG: PhoH family protein [Candidatus Binatia bacterium]|nr:PhoH family protein [Candidatus Binatia bacterium]
MLDDGGGAGGTQARNPTAGAGETAAEFATKLFVLDTNVILHDAGCIFAFHEHDVAIPITVLEELDRFKRGNGDLNAQARAFVRQLDGITGDVLSDEGATLGDGLGRARVILNQSSSVELREVFLRDSPDHRILAVALGLCAQEPGRSVVLVSKDVNLRLKARALGVVAQDYTRDKVAQVDRLYTGKRTVEHMRTEQIDAFYAGRVQPEDVPEVEEPLPNEAFVLRNGSKSVLATYGASGFRRVEKRAVYGIRPRNAEQSFAIDALMNPDVALVTLAGRAGTGKTLLALAAALEQRRNYRQILLARPVVALGNRDLGYLPGDISAKLDPYMQPLFDNLNVLRNDSDESGNGDKGAGIQKMLESDKLVVTPLSYIRGRSLPRVFFIVDEAQNLTPLEVKTIITRAGEGTKIVLTGDIHQIDQPYLDESSNGLSHLISRMVGQPLYAHMTLDKCERSPLAECASALL